MAVENICHHCINISWLSYNKTKYIFLVVTLQQKQSKKTARNKKKKSSNDPYSPYLQDFSTVIFDLASLHNQPSWIFELLHTTLQQNDRISLLFPYPCDFD